jgi:hypothetical protein
MRYTDEQNIGIRRKINDIKRNIVITNIKSKAIKLANHGNDPNIDNIIDLNDIETDTFKRKALFNEYIRKLLGDGDIHKYQKQIEDEGYDVFFLNNYPKISKELKMYQQPTGENLFTVIKKLYNREIQEISIKDDRDINAANMFDVKALLHDISLNLFDLMTLADTDKQRKELLDKQNKVDALIELLKKVGDEVVFLQEVFKTSYVDIITQLNQNAAQTAVPSNPSAPLPIINIPTPLMFDSITKGTFTNAINNYQQNQPTTPLTPTSMAQPAPSTPPQSLKKTQLSPTTDKLQYYNFDITSPDILTDAYNVTLISRITTTDYSKYIAKLLEPLNIKEKTILHKGTKDDMYKYFEGKLSQALDKIHQQEQTKQHEESYLKEEEQRQKEQNDRLQNGVMKQYRELEAEVDELYKTFEDILNNDIPIAERRRLYNQYIQPKYHTVPTIAIKNIRAITENIYIQRNELLQMMGTNLGQNP